MQNIYVQTNIYNNFVFLQANMYVFDFYLHKLCITAHLLIAIQYSCILAFFLALRNFFVPCRSIKTHIAQNYV